MRLIVENLSGERSGEAVFAGIGFSLEDGAALVVTGPNGSGKSTLLRVIVGLLPHTVGRITVEGGGEEFSTVASSCHYLGHHNAMKSTLTISENLAFWREFCGDGILGISDALEAVGLSGLEHLPFGYLSTGQKRRASIAKLLISHRPVWLLDEPTAGLDKTSERQFAELMKAHCVTGGIIISATHLPLGLSGMKTVELSLSVRSLPEIVGWHAC